MSAGEPAFAQPQARPAVVPRDVPWPGGSSLLRLFDYLRAVTRSNDPGWLPDSPRQSDPVTRLLSRTLQIPVSEMPAAATVAPNTWTLLRQVKPRSTEEVHLFAKQHKIAPGVLVGRMQRKRRSPGRT